MKLAAISLNFDSLAEAYRFPTGYEDVSFTRIADRFLDLADRLGIRYTIFIIGKDLDDPVNRAKVREWAERGHEIANHSWSHPAGFGSMSRDQIRDEVRRCHDRISETVGIEPRGFTAPGWMVSAPLFETLVELGYEYDASIAPSWLMIPALVKMLANHYGDPRFSNILRRRDFHLFLAGSRKPFLTRGSLRPTLKSDLGSIERPIVTLPLPTNRWRMACWHTLAFSLGPVIHRYLLNSCLENVNSFYYVTHPADLAGEDDFGSLGSASLERAGIALERKMELMESAFDVIRDSGRQFVTMRELARQARESGIPH